LVILVRGRRHLEAILPALRRRNILWQAQDIDPLANRMAVMDIHGLTRALCVSADRLAWLAILRAPWAGLNMADLLHLCEWQPDIILDERSELKPNGFLPVWCALSSSEHIPQLSTKGKLITKRLTESFQLAFKQLGKKPLRQIIESLWNSLSADAALLETRDKQDVEDYLDLLERFETGGAILDWNKFERRLEELYSQPVSLANPLPLQAPESKLQIMTIHKSKGLEFDHVYLPALGRVSATNNEPLLLWWQREYEDGSEGYLIAAKSSPNDKRSEYKDRQTLYDYLKAEEAERQRQETTRLLYVACTRARKSLFITAVLGWDDKQEQIRKPSGNSMLAILWDLYKEQFSQDYVPVSTEEDEQIRVLNTIRRLPADRPGVLGKEVKPETKPKEHKQNTNHTGFLSKYRFRDNYIARITGEQFASNCDG